MDTQTVNDQSPTAIEASSEQACYLYCVIGGETDRTFDVDGIGGKGDKVYTLAFDGLSAVVSDSPEAEYDSTRRNLTSHMRVLEAVMAEHTIVPIRFGSVAPNRDAIYETLLKPQRQSIDTLLTELEGRVEMGLKVFWMEGILYAEILAARPDITKLRDKLMGRSPDESYYDRVKVGELLEAAVVDKRTTEADELMRAIGPLAHRVQQQDAMGEQTLLSIAMLLDRSKADALEAVVTQLDQENEGRLLFKLVGPTAPYNFVDLSLAPPA